MEDKVKLMVEYVYGGEEPMSYTDLINIFTYRNEDGSKMWTFYNTTGHRKLPNNY